MVQALLILAFVTLTIGAAPVGWWIGGRPRVVWIPAAVLGLAGTIVFPIIARRPDLLLQLYPSREFAAIDPVWFVPFAVGFLGVAARQVDRRSTRIAVGVLSSFLVLLGAGSALWVVAGADIELRHSVDEEGVVRQTTYYTCGAAATATLCRRLGVPTTEAEMARRTGVVPGCGTTMVKVYWALQDMLGDRVERIRLLHAPELLPGAVPTPCVADLRLSIALNHLVLVREVRADCVVIEDPVHGLQRLPLSEARDLWSGSIVAIDLREPLPPVDNLTQRLTTEAARHAAPATAPTAAAPSPDGSTPLPSLSAPAPK